MLAGAGGGQNRLLGVINDEVKNHGVNAHREEDIPLIGVDVMPMPSVRLGPVADPTHEPMMYENKKYVRRSPQANRNNILNLI